jgi:2-polyprenyl-3-methyl-5-hydroxy-6-metoxy-1,4-benzoquinol methylase
MRKVMQEKIASGLLSEARVWDTDLSGTQLPDERFEIIVTVMVLHHVADTDGMLANFARLLEAGGYLCIVDLDTEDGSFHGAGFEGHRGFDRHDLARRLRAVGFSEVVIEDCYVLQKDGGDFPLFLATARRPDLIAAG